MTEAVLQPTKLKLRGKGAVSKGHSSGGVIIKEEEEDEEEEEGEREGQCSGEGSNELMDGKSEL